MDASEMRFQEGDWVLWNGEIKRVTKVAVDILIELDRVHMVYAHALAAHQIPWFKLSTNRWIPVGDQTQAQT